MKKILSIVMTLAILLAVVACGSTSPSAPSAPTSSTPELSASGSNTIPAAEPQQVNLTWGVAALGSSAQMVGSAIGTVTAKYYPQMQVSIQATAGSTENVRLLTAGEIDIANVNDAYNAAFSKGAYEGEAPAKLWALFNMYANAYVICVPAKSDVKTINDLIGKKVSLGPAGSGVYQAAYAIFEAHGLADKIEIITLGYNDANDALIDGSIDALVGLISGEIPSPALAQLDTSTKIRVIDIDQEQIKKAYEAYPDFFSGTIPAGCISAVTSDMTVFAGSTIEYANERMSDDAAYFFVKSIYEHVPELATYHQIAGKLAPETALLGVPKEIPVHPGAAKYYKEIGVWREDLTVAVR